MEIIKSFKGFSKDMTCCPGSTPFHYEEGKEEENPHPVKTVFPWRAGTMCA